MVYLVRTIGELSDIHVVEEPIFCKSGLFKTVITYDTSSVCLNNLYRRQLNYGWSGYGFGRIILNYLHVSDTYS